MKKCEICGQKLNMFDSYCSRCGTMIDEYEDYDFKDYNALDIDTKLKKQSQTVVFKDTNIKENDIYEYIKMLFQVYPLTQTFENTNVYYNGNRHAIGEYVINDYNCSHTIIRIRKINEYIYMTFNTYLNGYELKDLIEERVIMTPIMYLFIALAGILFLLSQLIGYTTIIAPIVLFMLFLFFYLLFDHLFELNDQIKKNKEIEKENEMIIHKWKDLTSQYKYNVEQHYIIEKLKEYLEEYKETSIENYEI